MQSVFELLATACSGVFAGAAVYISLVQHPAAAEAGRSVATSYFRPMYRRAAPMQASLAVVGSLGGLLAWFSDSGVAWLVGALLLGSAVPLTLVLIKPVNDRLLAPSLDPEAPEVPELLRRWGRPHRLRSTSSLLALLLFALG